MKKLILVLPLIIFGGCTQNVQPWEKATLAKDTMKEGGPNKLTKKFEEHIYYSKEATKGGGSIGGGGCGCN